MTILKLIGVATLAVLAALRLRLRLLLLLLLALLLLRYMHCRCEAPIKSQDSAPIKPYDITCPENKNCVPPSAPLDGGLP